MLVCQALSLLPRETFFAAAAGFLSYKARDMARYGEIWADFLSYGEPPSLPTACALQERAVGTCGIAAAAAAASAPPVGTTAPRLHSSWRTGRFRGSVDGAAA